MNAHFRTLAFLFTLASLSLAGSAPAQSETAAANDQAFSQQELDHMLAPVALYPDALLTQVLTAATYPLEVVEAARWSHAHPDLTGTDAVSAADAQNWDPSVKALLAFPDLLHMMDGKLDWTEHLGDAFLAQQAQVMDTVQGLRHKAATAGNLESGGELRVDDNDGMIDIEPAASDLVYLPYYDPNVVYGAWWWPAYPPMYWAAWPGYDWQGGFAWGVGVAISVDFFFDDFDWRHHCINVFDHGRPWHQRGRLAGDEPSHIWQHDPMHRRGVAYRDPGLNNRFGRASVAAGTPAAFRGHDVRAWPERTAPIAHRDVEHVQAGARMQRSYAGEGMPPPLAEPAMRRGNAGPGIRPGFVAPRAEMPPRALGGNGRMAQPARSGGEGHASVQRAPARSAPSSSRHP
ncbi:DUF3300 domain-containing protein [Dokdonella soli]|uniref:DUF3300 domain-containing protein n=1 Tax=Dokdonella soli TaxID=529810 RepID=A0ABN1IXW4_9GAMM